MRNWEADKEGVEIVQMGEDEGVDKSFSGGFVKQSPDLSNFVDAPRCRLADVFLCAFEE